MFGFLLLDKCGGVVVLSEWVSHKGWEVKKANEGKEEQGQEDPWCEEGICYIYFNLYVLCIPQAIFIKLSILWPLCYIHIFSREQPVAANRAEFRLYACELRV